jgi:hypothetical protein
MNTEPAEDIDWFLIGAWIFFLLVLVGMLIVIL